jgi:vacuolar-type H+-ATPase subunit H
MLSLVALKKAWSWLKAHWYWPVIAVLGIVTLVVTRKPPTWVFDMMKKKQELMEEEHAAIDRAENEASEAKFAATDRFNEVVEEIERNHSDRKDELDKKKEREIRKIIKDTKNDPAAITNEIAERFGFTVVLPEDS